MAGLGDLLQRIARSLEEAQAQRPADDLRARLGYGTGDEDELAEDAVRKPEPAREPVVERAAVPVWTPAAPRTPAAGTLRTSAAHRTSTGEDVSGERRASRPAPPHPHTSSASLLSERLRARLRTPDALREAFVVKEILDRPLARRRGRNAR